MLENEIANIKKAIQYVMDDNMGGLAYDQDCWDHGIHEHMDASTMPFELSFDEEMAERTEAEIQELRPFMLTWLEETLSAAVNSRVYECLWHTYGITGETIVDYNTWHDCEEQEEKNWFRLMSTKRLRK